MGGAGRGAEQPLKGEDKVIRRDRGVVKFIFFFFIGVFPATVLSEGELVGEAILRNGIIDCNAFCELAVRRLGEQPFVNIFNNEDGVVIGRHLWIEIHWISGEAVTDDLTLCAVMGTAGKLKNKQNCQQKTTYFFDFTRSLYPNSQIF